MARDMENDSVGDGFLNRRSYLRLAGATAATAAATGTMGSSAAAQERHDIQFDNVVNAVDDLNCDPTGSEPIQQQVRNAASNNTLIVFPEGTYKVSGNLILKELQNFGMYGDGAVSFKIPANTQCWAPSYDYMDNCLFEGIDIDQTARNAVAFTRWGSSGYLYVKDVEMKGAVEALGRDSTKFRAFPYSRASDGITILENFAARDGGVPGEYQGGGGGIYIGASHNGTTKLIDCEMWGHPNNGVYASRTNGAVHIEGGVYKNNEVSQIRISGEKSYADGCKLVIDYNDWGDGTLGDKSNSLAARAVWWETGRVSKTGGELRNLDVFVSDAHGGPVPGGIVVDDDGGALTLKNSRIKCDIDGVPAIRADAPGGGNWPASPTPRNIMIENTSITGSAGSGPTVLIRGRQNSYIRDSCIQQTGNNRLGVRFIDCGGSTVADTSIDVDGQNVDLQSTSADVVNITSDGSCQLPNSDSGSSSPFSVLPEHPNQLTVRGSQGAEYSFTVENDAAQSEHGDASYNENATIQGETITGTITDGADGYTFDGDFVSFDADSSVTVTVNGTEVDVQTLAGGFDHALSIEGHDTGVVSEYDFTVDGAVIHTQDMNATLNPEEKIDDGSVTGHVRGGLDSFRVLGNVTAFNVNGEVTTYLDGVEVSVDSLLDSSGDTGIDLDPGLILGPDESNADILSIDGQSGKTNYAFTVDGAVDHSTEIAHETSAEATVNPEDNVSGSNAWGSVWNGVDTYAIDGDITSFELDGDADVYLNGELVDIASLSSGPVLPNSIVIDGTDATQSTYTFTVDGDVKKSAELGSVNRHDTVSDGVVDGRVAGGVDAYRFTGEITKLRLEGSATVNFESQE